MNKIRFVPIVTLLLPVLALAFTKMTPKQKQAKARKPAAMARQISEKFAQKPIIRAQNPAWSDTSIQPDLFESWLTETDKIKENPPYLFEGMPAKNLRLMSCPQGVEGGMPGDLRRTCFNSSILTGPDLRFKEQATLENRLHLIRHYVDAFRLPLGGRSSVITTDWFFRKSSQQGGGVDDLNSIIGMIRYQLYLTQATLANKAEAEELRWKNDANHKKYVEAFKKVTLAEINGLQRQRRLLDFWFPDGPAWTVSLLDACSAHEHDMPAARCCFRTLLGCDLK